MSNIDNNKTRFEKLQTYFLYFFFCCVLGWIYEVVLEVFIYKWGFSNRGFLFGPYLPIYGIGALLFLIFLSGLKKKKIKIGPIPITPLLVFLGAMVIATLAELICSYIMEWTTGDWLWNYSGRFNYCFQGRIALNPSIRFGIGGVILLYLVQPIFEKIVKLVGKKGVKIMFFLFSGIMLLDLIVKLINML